ncbi:hypothetical protein C8F01DRAFT_326223 [Mycena amicta]|nr:hypothetical protein C8F01DRAFT_326223 [Mycena amicta]
MRCSTMSRVFSWFNRDLTSITLSAWMEHEKVILGEYNSWRGITVAAPKPIGMPASETAHKPARPQEAPKTAQDKILCPYCRRQFSSDSLSKHVVVKHPDVDPNAFAPPGLLHCLQCPRSTTSRHRRLFTGEGLLAHQLAEHSPEKTLCPHCPGSEKTFSPGPLAQHIKAKHSV